MDAEARKQALKALRKERAQWIAGAAADMKRQKRELKGIRECLAAGPATVPQIAEQTELPVDLVLWYVAALKKYGELVEGAKKGSHFEYTLCGGPTDSKLRSKGVHAS